MKTQASSYSVLALLAVCRALAVEPCINGWGPITNRALMAISVNLPGNVKLRDFPLDGTNNAQMPVSIKGGKNEIKAGEPFSLLVRI